MAFQAPCHAEWLDVSHHFHLINAAMTGNTANSTLNVGRMVEINKVWQAMHFDPFDGRLIVPAFTNQFQAAFIEADLGMAGHAGFGRRDVGLARLLDIGMAISAIDAKLPGMDGVAIVHRLLGLIPNMGRLVVEAKPGENQEKRRPRQGNGEDDPPRLVEPFREEEQRLLRCRSGGSFRHRGRLVLVPTMMTKPHRLWEVSRFDANDKSAIEEE